MPGDPNQEWPSMRSELELPPPTSKTLVELNRLMEEIKRLEAEAYAEVTVDRTEVLRQIFKERDACLRITVRGKGEFNDG